MPKDRRPGTVVVSIAAPWPVRMLDWIENPQLRMECQAGLNKGEARHTLARAVFAHSQGRIRDRSHDAQQKRVMAPNLVIAAIVYWNTTYMDKTTDHLRRWDRLAEPSLLRHVSPLGSVHIVLTGVRLELRRRATHQRAPPQPLSGDDSRVVPGSDCALNAMLRTNFPMTPEDCGIFVVCFRVKFH